MVSPFSNFSFFIRLLLISYLIFSAVINTEEIYESLLLKAKTLETPYVLFILDQDIIYNTMIKTHKNISW